MVLKYNKIRVFAFNRSTGAPVTGDAANITATWSKDNGTPAALADTNPTEIGGGLYVFDLSVAERTVAVEGFLWPVSSTSGVGVVVARAIEAEGSQDINTWVHSDVAGVTTDITSMRWWTGVAWADLFVHAGTDRPNSGGVDGPGHYHSYCALPIPQEMFVEFNGVIYPLGKRPQMAKSTTLFIDPQGTIGGLLDADIYDDLFGALATVSDASPITGGVLALSDIASAASVAALNARLTSGTLTVAGPVLTGNELERLKIGDDYKTANGRSITFTFDSAITPASCTLVFTQSECTGTPDVLTLTGSASASDGTVTCVFEIDADDWTGISAGNYSWVMSVVDSNGNTLSFSSSNQRVPFVEFYS